MDRQMTTAVVVRAETQGELRQPRLRSRNASCQDARLHLAGHGASLDVTVPISFGLSMSSLKDAGPLGDFLMTVKY